MGEADLLAYICENISGLSNQARAVIAETIIATERGIHLDYRRMVNNALEAEAESEHAGLAASRSEAAEGAAKMTANSGL